MARELIIKHRRDHQSRDLGREKKHLGGYMSGGSFEENIMGSFEPNIMGNAFVGRHHGGKGGGGGHKHGHPHGGASGASSSSANLPAGYGIMLFQQGSSFVGILHKGHQLIATTSPQPDKNSATAAAKALLPATP